MSRQSISFTKPNDEWLKTQVDNKEYSSKSELVNDLIRQARKQQVQIDSFSFESVDYLKKGYRRCVCGVDSIYYKVNENIVEIMAIVGQQDLINIV